MNYKSILLGLLAVGICTQTDGAQPLNALRRVNSESNLDILKATLGDKQAPWVQKKLIFQAVQKLQPSATPSWPRWTWNKALLAGGGALTVYMAGSHVVNTAFQAVTMYQLFTQSNEQKKQAPAQTKRTENQDQQAAVAA